MAAKLNRAPIAALRADSLCIGGVDKVLSFGLDRKRSFDQSEPPESVDDDLQAVHLSQAIDNILKDDEDDEDGLMECSTKSVKDFLNLDGRPKLVRTYTIGTTGTQHMAYDIHATHQLDLHDALVHANAKVAKTAEDETVDSANAWLKKLMKERNQPRPQSPNALPSATPAPAAPSAFPAPAPALADFLPAAAPAASAFAAPAPVPSIGESSLPEAAASKAWAVMRQAVMASMFLKVLSAAKEAGNLDGKTEASLQELSQKLQPSAGPASFVGSATGLPAFDVPEWVEQAFMAQAQAGELGDLFATFANAYLPQQSAAMLDPAQMLLVRSVREQQQHYLMQLQVQQQRQQQMQQQMEQMQQMQKQLQQQEQFHNQQMYQQQMYQQKMKMEQVYQRHLTPSQYYWGGALPTQQPQPAVPPMDSVSPISSRSPTRSPPRSPPGLGAGMGLTVNLGKLCEAARTKEGSQALQRQLHSMPPALLQEACSELAPQLVALSLDTFGNYLVSSMATLQQAQPIIAAALRGHVVELATHAQGSRVLQAVLEALPTVTVAELVSELSGRIVEVALKTYGSFSVCTAYKATHAPFILNEIASSVEELSVMQDGSRVVQRVLPEAAKYGANISVVLDALIALGQVRLGRLAADQFGNYVVQAALRLVDSGNSHQRTLLTMLLPCLPALSVSKGGSNAAEAVLGCLSADLLPEARRLLTQDNMCDLTSHRYGMHVMLALHRRGAQLGC